MKDRTRCTNCYRPHFDKALKHMLMSITAEQRTKKKHMLLRKLDTHPYNLHKMRLQHWCLAESGLLGIKLYMFCAGGLFTAHLQDIFCGNRFSPQHSGNQTRLNYTTGLCVGFFLALSDKTQMICKHPSTTNGFSATACATSLYHHWR